MDLPDAEKLRALLAAARDCGATKLRIGSDGSLDVELSPVAHGERIVDAINRGAPLPEDPIDVIRREAGAASRPTAQDLLDVLANGGRLIDVSGGDPTQAA